MLDNKDEVRREDRAIVAEWFRESFESAGPGKTVAALAAATGATRQGVYAWRKTGRISKRRLALAIEFFGRPGPVFGNTVSSVQEPERGFDWPFPDIARERFARLTLSQRIEIQGVVRERIERFEAEAENSANMAVTVRARRA